MPFAGMRVRESPIVSRICADSVQHNAPDHGLFAQLSSCTVHPPIDIILPAGKSFDRNDAIGRVDEMKDSSNAAKQLLDLPYAPEAEQYLDELERSGQFRIGVEAEIEDAEAGESAAGNDYGWGRGSGSVSIQDWWTSGRVTLRIGAGTTPGDVLLARINDSLVVRTQDGLDRLVLEGYLGLIPDASTLRIIFSDGQEWAGAELLSHIGSWLAESESGAHNPDKSGSSH
jgi:hypothetical protein